MQREVRYQSRNKGDILQQHAAERAISFIIHGQSF